MVEANIDNWATIEEVISKVKVYGDRNGPLPQAFSKLTNSAACEDEISFPNCSRSRKWRHNG